MKIALLHPPLSEISGGNLYNRNILHQARLCRFPLHSVTVPAIDRDRLAEWQKNYELLIWDSLFWRELAGMAETLQDSPSGLLCHYLPSLNPLAAARDRAVWRETECRAIESMRFVIATGQAVFDEIQKRFPSKSVGLCEPGIDEAFKQPESVQKNTSTIVQFLTVANLLPEKGYLDILEALSGLSEWSWQWHFCGSDRVDAEFTQLFWRSADELNLLDRIRYEGVLTSEQVAELMLASDVFVSASHYESYGIGLAEAAAMRLPIVASETGAAGQIVRHGVNGFLFVAGDISALRDHLARLIREKRLRRRFREQQCFEGRSWGQCFTIFERLCKDAFCLSSLR
ncbi:glycosyltransferase family 4 protein [Methylotuvimicrobium alcaliphilum]|uniref:Glycosyltransferase n=1 Tax=Methylotuvimicrobium alcaliphilum (strain DSM 19304 / NCIMB 14124 / VKM B-2133 / 20Z) TaxID=1091494 RepID=G4T4A7_META2|nr:glycosyltransferase family 4 protein [Methylotuvimicrobium alcaliphilum]CCE24918.1 putative glycosyltransferase [Methylotuvimicrobium alcaliphilum 20Z]